jgi:hypothetical protein
VQHRVHAREARQSVEELSPVNERKPVHSFRAIPGVQVGWGVDQNQIRPALLKQGPDDPIADKTEGACDKKTHVDLAWIIHECRSETAEAEARRGFSQVRATQAYLQSVEETEREKPRRARESVVVVGVHE